MTATADDAATTLARRAAAAMYAGDAASRACGITIEDVGAGFAVCRMTVTADMLNGHGICHGGYVFLLADSAFAFACNSRNQSTVAQACDIVFVDAVRAGDVLSAEARERVLTGRTGVYDVTVRRDAPGGQVVAEFRGRSRTIRGTLVPTREPDLRE
jgi:phenylacetic acid degradation protein PaaD